MTGLSLKAALLAAALLAVPLAPPASAQPAGGTIVVGLFSNLANPDPQMAPTQADAIVQMHAFESLVTLGEDMGPALQLAEALDISADGRTYTFTLRPGVKFHNGKIMTSADVLASWQRYGRVSPGKGVLATVAEMSAPDERTFVVRLNDADYLFLDRLRTPRFPIAVIPAEESEKPAFEINYIGTGPYSVAEVVPGDRITLKRFPDYVADDKSEGPNGYAGKRTASIDTIVFRTIPEAGTRVAGLEAGDLQVIDQVPVSAARRLAGDSRFQVMDIDTQAKTTVIAHASQSPTDNVLIRRAIQAAINADEILTIAQDGAYTLDPSFLYPTSAYHTGDAMAGIYNQGDIEKAKALLKEAGYNGEPIRLQTNSNTPVLKTGTEVLAEQLKAAGMNAVIDLYDRAQFTRNLNTGEGGWNITMSNWASQPLVGPPIYETNFKELSHFASDPVLDDAFARLRRADTLEGRKAAWLDVEKRVGEEAYVSVLGNVGTKLMLSSRIEGVNGFYTPRFWTATLKP